MANQSDKGKTAKKKSGNSKKKSGMTGGKVLATAAGVAAATAAGVVAVKKFRGNSGGAKLKVYHVLPGDEGWSVKAEDAERASSTHSTKKEALDAARELVKGREPSQLVIHRLDGTVQDAHTYQVEN